MAEALRMVRYQLAHSSRRTDYYHYGGAGQLGVANRHTTMPTGMKHTHIVGTMAAAPFTAALAALTIVAVAVLPGPANGCAYPKGCTRGNFNQHYTNTYGYYYGVYNRSAPIGTRGRAYPGCCYPGVGKTMEACQESHCLQLGCTNHRCAVARKTTTKTTVTATSTTTTTTEAVFDCEVDWPTATFAPQWHDQYCTSELNKAWAMSRDCTTAWTAEDAATAVDTCSTSSSRCFLFDSDHAKCMNSARPRGRAAATTNAASATAGASATAPSSWRPPTPLPRQRR